MSCKSLNKMFNLSFETHNFNVPPACGAQNVVMNAQRVTQILFFFFLLGSLFGSIFGTIFVGLKVGLKL